MHEAGLEVKRSPSYIRHNKYFCYLSESICIFRLVAIFHMHPSSGLLASLPRSWYRLDDDHMTAIVHRRWGRSYSWSRFMVGCPILISLASLTFRFSQISSLSSTLTLSFVICGVCAHSCLIVGS